MPRFTARTVWPNQPWPRPRTTARAALRLLQRLVPTRGAEMSVALLDPEGDVWAWAGRHRLPPVAEGDSIGSRATGYYVVLEARRHSAEGRIAVAGVLIWAHPAVPGPVAQRGGVVP